MINILKRSFHFFFDQELIKHASITFIATFIGGICNYLFQLYMGRALGPAEYGIFGSLFAISYVLSVITSTIQTGVTRFVSKFRGENEHQKINYFIRGTMKRLFFVSIFIVLIIFSTSGYISSFLNIGTTYPVIILGTVFFFSTLFPVNLGTLQGLQKFGQLGFNNFLSFFSKLVFGFILVSFGFGVNGAIGAIVIGSGFSLLVSSLFLKSYLTKNYDKKQDFAFKELYKYSFPTMVAMFCFAVPANVDLIIVKHFFDAHSAGLYTAITVLGKIILFFSGAISIVMFPKISKLHTENKNTIHILIKSLFYTTGLAGVIALIYWLFPFHVISIPYGIEYVEIIPILQIYGFVMFFFSLTVVIMGYYLAIHDVKFIFLFAISTVTEIVLIAIFNSSLMEIVQILFTVNIVLFFLSIIYTVLDIKIRKSKLVIK